MTPTLNEVNEVVAKRIHQLRKDIEEVETRLAMYRAELEPLLKIAKVAESLVSGTKETVESSATPSNGSVEAPAKHSPKVLEEEEEEEEDIKSHSHSRRWSHLRLAPRYRRFIERFSSNENITRNDIRSWYRRALNPSIQDNSLETAVQQIIRELTTKRVLQPRGEDTWVVVR
jgi:cell division septum initiation protein DivIVA